MSPQPLPPATDPEATRVRPDEAATRVMPQPWWPERDATVVRTRIGAAAPPPPPGMPPLPREPSLALQPGFRLHEYRIDQVLGQGGFGITYRATDTHLDAGVAIKEYLPAEIAFRAGDRSVSPNASRHRDRYRQGLESFLVEARTLASLRHPAIVRVARFFEAHQTAYMVMELEQGQPFKRWWPEHDGLDEAVLVERLLPLMDGLAVVHDGGFLHRDIKPENIQVRSRDGSLVLLDFGSAGQTVALAEPESVVLTPGFAPIEQYGLGRQGPWTDVYALGATLYWALTGRKPPDAEMRAAAPSCYVPVAQAAQASGGPGTRFGPAFLAAVDWALQPDPGRRPQDVASFRRALCADHLASLDLQQALQAQDSELDSDLLDTRPDETIGEPPPPARPDGDTTLDAISRPTAPGTRPGSTTAERRAKAQRQARVLRRHSRWRRALSQLARPRDWPLAWKLGVAMGATALLPMLSAGLYNLAGSQQALADAELRLVSRMATGLADRLGQFVADSGQQAAALATDPAWSRALAAADDPAVAAATNQRLAALVAVDPELKAVLLLDRYGQVPASSDPALRGRDFSFQRPFQAVISGQASVSGLVVVPGAAGADLFVAAPLRDEARALAGVLMLRIDGAAITRMLGASPGSALTPFLVDADGVLVEHPEQRLRYSSLVPLPEATLGAIRADQRFARDDIPSLGETALAAALQGARAPGHVSYRSAVHGRDEIAGFAPVAGLGWTVGVSEPREVFEAPLQTLERQLWWSVGLVGLLFTGLALRTARGIVRPIRALTAAADALKAGDYAAAAVDVRRRDEVGQLARTFNVMVDVLRQRERERALDRRQRRQDSP